MEIQTMGAGDQLFEREVRKVLDAKVEPKAKAKYIKMLKTQYRDKGDLINRILADYEGEK
jgi:hypothetical protein